MCIDCSKLSTSGGDVKILNKLGDGLAWVATGWIPSALRLFMGEKTEVRIFDEEREVTKSVSSNKTSVVFEIVIILVIIWLLALIAFATPKQDERPPTSQITWRIA
jgi:hypothetical protein